MSVEFELLDKVLYNSVSPAELGEIIPITCFSEFYDGMASLESTDALMKFTWPQLDQDLTLGYDGWVEKVTKCSPKAKALDRVVQSCLDSKYVSHILEADVVTTRGVLTR